MAHPTKEQIVALLYAWISQRPGLEFRNYCSGWNDRDGLRAYRSEVRSIGRDLSDARQLLRAVELSGITAEELAAAFPRAFSGRLVLEAHPTKPGAWRLDYCTGQYWPTEYRAAACAVLASALWTYKRERCMPAPVFHCSDGLKFATMEEATKYVSNPSFASIIAIEERYKGMRAGDYLRDSFRREYGRTMQKRWFD